METILVHQQKESFLVQRYILLNVNYTFSQNTFNTDQHTFDFSMY